VANIVVSQIAGVVLINTVLVILALVFIPIIISLFPEDYDPNNPKNQQRLQGQLNQETHQQQTQPQAQPPYYNGAVPYADNGYPPTQYVVYQ
jgi:hypothetical protein